MVMLVVAALYVMGGLAFILSAVSIFSAQGGGNAIMLLIGSGIMLGLAAVAESLAKINAKLK